MTTGYLYPSSIEEAVELLSRHNGEARIIAGGTDVLPDLRKGKIAPCCLVDITRVPELDRIEVEDDFVTVGAAVTFAEIARHTFLRDHVHALVDAARSVGALAIQNAATWVGNIVQAMPAADGAIIALGLDAEAYVVDGNGGEWRWVESMFGGPGVSTVDPTQEIVTQVRFPRPTVNTGTAWRRVGRRSALVLPILSCAVRTELDSSAAVGCVTGSRGRLLHAAIALGPVSPRPYRARRAERYLEGREATPEAFEEAGHIAQGEANPRSSVMRASRVYRLSIIPTLVSQALTEAVSVAELP